MEIETELDCSVRATAHHADDQAETLLMRLLRGTGPDGLAGIAPRSSDGVVRPLLFVPRAEIERFAGDQEIAWREDSSNASDHYQRNRIRHHWLPALTEEFNPKLLRALGDLAEAQRRDAEWIEEHVAVEARARFSVEGSWLRIDTREWKALPEALARRLAREAMLRCGAGRHVTRRHLERLLAFLVDGRSGSSIELPGDLRLRCEGGSFRLGPTSPDVNSRSPGAC
jgi:tRNA(Ile)-lysidine synthase